MEGAWAERLSIIGLRIKQWGMWMASERTWIIGSAAECDLVVSQPTVSGRHCRLSRTPSGFLLEDLGSTNGTFINGFRISSTSPVTPQDTITLGKQTPMPWPPMETDPRRVIRIGRAPDNDVVADFANVSSQHAQLIVDERGITLEDLGSTNGTAVGVPENRVTRAPVQPHDTIFLASLPFRVSSLIQGRAEPLVMAQATQVVPTQVVARPDLAAPQSPGSLYYPPSRPPRTRQPSSLSVVWIAAATVFIVITIAGIGFGLRSPSTPATADSNGLPSTPSESTRPTQPPDGIAPPRDAKSPNENSGPDTKSSGSDEAVDSVTTSPTPSTTSTPVPANCLYSVCATAPSEPQKGLGTDAATESEAQTYRLGTACAISERQLVTSAAVILSFELLREKYPIQTVYCPPLKRELAIGKTGIHPAFLEAETEAREARAAFESALAEARGRKVPEQEKSAVNEKLAQLYRTFADAAQRQVHFDIGVLEVKEPLPQWLPVAPDERKLRPKSGVRVLGLAFDAEDPYLDRETPAPVAEMASRVMGTLPIADSRETALRFVGSCGPEHLVQNWFGSPVLNGQSQVIAIYSRPVPDSNPTKPPPGDAFEGPLASRIAELLPSIK